MKLRGLATVTAAVTLATTAFAFTVEQDASPAAAAGAQAVGLVDRVLDTARRAASGTIRTAQVSTPPVASQPPTTTPVAPASYSVIGVGDIMMGSDWPEPGMDPRVAPMASAVGVMGPELAQRFATTDVVFGNFEGTIHTSGENAKECRNPAVCFVFRSPPFHAEYLRRAGFTLMSNANNHSRDFGESGRAETYRNLTAAGIAVAGADVEDRRIGVQTLPDGTRFALVAFGHNPGLLSVQNYARLAEMVREADSRADVVIVSCHIGAEGARYDRVTRATEIFLEEDRGNPHRFAHAAVDAGADIVFCHGPHVPRAIELYRGRFIAYSLGNFWTYGRFNLAGVSGMAPIAALEVGRDGALRSARIISARQDRPGGPYLDPSGAAARQIAFLSNRDIPEAGISIAPDGTVSWPR